MDARDGCGFALRPSPAPLVGAAGAHRDLLEPPLRAKRGYIVLFQAIVLGLGYLIPYYAQVVGGLNEFSAGCLLLPGCLIGVFAGKAKSER